MLSHLLPTCLVKIWQILKSSCLVAVWVFSPRDASHFELIRDFDTFSCKISRLSLCGHNKTTVKKFPFKSRNISNIHHNLPHYLSPSEHKALQELKCNTDLIINKVGKGSTIVVQNMADYIKDALQHLNDPDTYRVLDGDPTSNICNTLETTSPTPFTKFPIQGNH